MRVHGGKKGRWRDAGHTGCNDRSPGADIFHAVNNTSNAAATISTTATGVSVALYENVLFIEAPGYYNIEIF